MKVRLLVSLRKALCKFLNGSGNFVPDILDFFCIFFDKKDFLKFDFNHSHSFLKCKWCVALFRLCVESCFLVHKFTDSDFEIFITFVPLNIVQFPEGFSKFFACFRRNLIA